MYSVTRKKRKLYDQYGHAAFEEGFGQGANGYSGSYSGGAGGFGGFGGFKNAGQKAVIRSIILMEMKRHG